MVKSSFFKLSKFCFDYSNCQFFACFVWVFSSNCIFCSCLNLLSMSNFVFWLLNLAFSLWRLLRLFCSYCCCWCSEQKCCFAFCFQIWLIVILVCRFELIVNYCWEFEVVIFFVIITLLNIDFKWAKVLFRCCFFFLVVWILCQKV